MEDDVAHVTLGDEWRIPSRAEAVELIENCDWEYTTLNGVKGVVGTSKSNSKTIFFPFAGYKTSVNVADTDPNPNFWSKRQHKSGFGDPRNPYRAGDYFHVDPEYGTDADLRDFVDRTHVLGMKVLLDLVFFHCGPSAGVLLRHPEYFRHNPDGFLMLGEWHFPTFDYDNPATRAYLKSIMAYYVADFDVDGFRLDVADQVPLDFWEEAREMLDALRPGLVLAAEGDRPENTLKAMDINYNFPVCRKLRKMVSDHFKRGGVMDISQIRRAHEEYMSQCPRGTLVWNYSENHDTATDSYDNRMEKCYGYQFNTLYLAFCFALDGVPFIVNGQEACYDRRISLFGHKDCWIDWETALATPQAQERQANIRSWAQMRRDYSSLTSGKTVWLDNNCPESVCSFVRRDGVSPDIFFVGNFSDQKRKIRLSDGHRLTLEPFSFFFGPWK